MKFFVTINHPSDILVRPKIFPSFENGKVYVDIQFDCFHLSDTPQVTCGQKLRLTLDPPRTILSNKSTYLDALKIGTNI